MRHTSFDLGLRAAAGSRGNCPGQPGLPKRIKNMWALLLLATRTTSQEHITARAVEQRGLSLYDVPCAETEGKHTCACQIRCEAPSQKRCQKGLSVCSRVNGCEYVVTNPSGEWATLKRRPTPAELDRVNFAGKKLTQAELESSRSSLEAEGLVARRNYTGGFAAALKRAQPSKHTYHTNSYCGTSYTSVHDATVALVALSYRTPATLRNSMLSWRDSGLLSFVDERILMLNDPAPSEVALGLKHGFEVLLPSDIQKRIGPQMPRQVKREVLTIGAAFAAACAVSTSTHVLFLEKDFAVAPGTSLDDVASELAAAVVAAKRGAAVVRLRSIQDQGCGTFRRCQDNRNMPQWNGRTTFERRRNWWSFYCRDFQNNRVADCASYAGSSMRCFSAWDSNWSLNAVLVDRVRALEEKWAYKRGRTNGRFRAPGTSLAAYGAATWQKQDGFEVGMLKDDWGRTDMPICLSTRGLFAHVEVDG